MALVGANFPDMKGPGEAGEITNTPVKDLLEQFKADDDSYFRVGSGALTLTSCRYLSDFSFFTFASPSFALRLQ